MPGWTDDPVADAAAYYDEQEREMEKLPVCSECDNPIQTSKCYQIEGKLFCPQCVVDNFQQDTADYIKDGWYK